MLCRICEVMDEGERVVICSACVQILLAWTVEKTKEVLISLARKLEKVKGKVERQRIRDKIRWIEYFKGMRRRKVGC